MAENARRTEINFTNSGRRDGRGETIWNLRGPAELLVPEAVVTVTKRGGTTIRKVVGRVLSTEDTAVGKVAVAEIHRTLTVAEATKRAKRRAKAAPQPETTPNEPSPAEQPEQPDQPDQPEEADLASRPVGLTLW